MVFKEKLIDIYQKCPLWLQDIFFKTARLAHIEPQHEFVRMVLDDWKGRQPEDPELAEALVYLKTTKCWTAFPGKYTEKYRALKINADKSEDGFPFVLVDRKKLYFPKRFGKAWSAGYFRALISEQDPDSPHRYFSDSFPPPGIHNHGDILLDIGAAEAIVSLQYIDQVKHVFIFECEEEWIEVLNKTFYLYKDKVTIVQKYVSDINGNNQIRLDDYIRNCRQIDGFNERFIVKMDIEGAEAKALRGCEELLRCKRSRFVVCTYHKPDDAQEFDHLFKEAGYQTEFSKNYMLYGGEGYGEPSFRKGVVRAW